VKSTNFDSHKKFRREITRTLALFEASTHSFSTLLSEGKERLRKTGAKSGSAALDVGDKIVKVPWSKLTYHARDLYPRELRFVLLTRLVTIYEVFLVNIVQDVSRRSKVWLIDDGRIETSHEKLLTDLWNDDIEKNIIEKHLRSLTNGGLTDKRKFFQKKFGVELIPPNRSLHDLEKIHDLRNLFVHRGGAPDHLFATKYSLTKKQAKHRQHVSIEDIYDAISLFEGSAWHVATNLEAKFPGEIKASYTFGNQSFEDSSGEICLIEFSCKKQLALTPYQDMTLPIIGGGVWKDYIIWQGIEGKNITALISGRLTKLFKTLNGEVMDDHIHKLRSTKINRSPKVTNSG
tara:strand:+ start:151 stop:1191 length:1041 start_codon:yes stop_codon:yes gene_type:complete